MRVLLLTTIKQRLFCPLVPLNDIAVSARPTSRGAHGDDEAVVWRIPAGAELDLPDETARHLIRLKYAEPITPSVQAG